MVESIELESKWLGRTVLADCYLPSPVANPAEISLLLLNDGQNLEEAGFAATLETLYQQEQISPLLCVGIHCGENRKMEYGCAISPDFKGRGASAGLYTSFIMEELLPLIRSRYHISAFREKAFAGFSLGGLSALDIVWNHPGEFNKAGVFSGSLWWRDKGLEDEDYDDDNDRIMHRQIRGGEYHPWLQFFFQTGTEDEKMDRNQNGIIDVIDDTLDLMKELEKLGYHRHLHIRYLEVKGGRHDVATWGQSLPEFIKWGWGIKDLLM